MRPVAFRIWDFKCIRDSGECELSADGISVLAGQNECGKTSILTALRDFDLEVDAAPETADYKPEGRFDATPRVGIKFLVDVDDLMAWLGEQSNAPDVPLGVAEQLRKERSFWIYRNLNNGVFHLDDALKRHWMLPGEASETESSVVESEDDEDEASASDNGSDVADQEASAFAAFLREYWPSIVYFDSFEDILPRKVDISSLLVLKTPTLALSPKTSIAQPVRDFLTLAGINLKTIQAFADDDKTLGNYLASRAATLTGDFLSYWKQRVDGDEIVHLRVRHLRDEQGNLQLAFYVHDQVDQYPEQRSKGFLWFLSFYLRLAAAHHRNKNRSRLLLIDEPGTYLHARAQRDVVHLFEDRLAKKDQVVYSTHSPFLIPADKLHRLRVVVKTTRGGAVILSRLTDPLLRGDEFSDTLSPILYAIGLDVRGTLDFVSRKNLIVEGITDLFYLSSFCHLTGSTVASEFNIFPGTGATSVVTLTSLFLGWGLPFIATLDHDGPGNEAAFKLINELGVKRCAVLQPNGAAGLEDLISHEDFRALLREFDPQCGVNAGESPTRAIRRQQIDKVLLARKFSELVFAGGMAITNVTRDRINAYLESISEGWAQLENMDAEPIPAMA